MATQVIYDRRNHEPKVAEEERFRSGSSVGKLLYAHHLLREWRGWGWRLRRKDFTALYPAEGDDGVMEAFQHCFEQPRGEHNAHPWIKFRVAWLSWVEKEYLGWTKDALGNADGTPSEAQLWQLKRFQQVSQVWTSLGASSMVLQ